MSGPTVHSWAKVAAQKSNANTTQQVPATQQTTASGAASTSSVNDAVSTPSTSVTAPASETNDTVKTEAHESSSNAPIDLQKALNASTFSDEVPAASAALPLRDDDASVAGSQATSGAERNPKSSNASARGHDDPTSRKTRKPKRSRTTEKDDQAQSGKTKAKEPEPVKIVELKEAAAPSVNPWQLRIAAQAAKQLPTATSSTAALVNGVSKTGGSRSAAGAGASSAATAANGSAPAPSKPQKQGTESSHMTGDQQSKRTAPRGNRIAEKEEKPAANAAMPVVGDATSWPTPTAATVEEKKTKAAPAKAHTEEEPSASKPAEKTTWSKLDFVPSVTFNTPIPTMNRPKPRGGGRGGRDTGTRGGHAGPAGAQPSDRPASGATTGTTKPTEPRNAPGASVQGPAPAKQRAPVEAPNGREPRKPASPPNGDRAKEIPSADQNTESKKAGPATRDARNEYVNGEAAAPSRSTVGRKSPEYAGHGGFAASKDGQQGGRGGRGGRGRGGAHGGHPIQTNLSQTPYPYNPRYPNNGPFSAQPGAPPFASPPSQYGFGPAPAAKPGRNNGRSQSLSGSAPYLGQPSGPRVGRMGSLQTQNPGFYEQQFYPLDPAHPFPGPYSTGSPDANIITGIKSQVEWYFSMDNLVSDYRTKMMLDSQGFIPLKTLAKFPRITQLMPDYGFLIAACQSSDKLEYITSDRGEDFVRARDFWDRFVLPMHQRDKDAQHAGPDLARSTWRSFHVLQPAAYGFYPPQQTPPMYQAASPTAMGGYAPMTNGGGEFYPSLTNGVQPETMTNGDGAHDPAYHGESQLSANVPDFSPSGTFGKAMTLEQFQNLPDEKLAGLTLEMATKDPVTNGTHGTESDDASNNEESMKSGPYPECRTRALAQRDAASADTTVCPLMIRQLYFWWAHFLPKNFNISMYEEFRRLATEDAKLPKPRPFGLKQLINFTERVAKDNEASPPVFAEHRAEAEKLLEALHKSTLQN